MKKFILAGAACLSLAACTIASDPMEAEDGSFVITSTADAFGTQSMAMQKAQSEAKAFCAQQGKRAVAVSADHQNGPVGGVVTATRNGMSGFASSMRYDADLRFRCV